MGRGLRQSCVCGTLLANREYQREMRIMFCLTFVQRLFVLGAIAALLGAPICASAAEQAPQSDAVEFFQAIQDGQIEVKLIPRNVKEANVLIENKGQQPLSIKLPDAFAGVPVLAQFGGMGGMGGMGGG
ncbi:MAG: hypothetical protein EA424_12780, partial [Planctomycetaceae bacterium]